MPQIRVTSLAPYPASNIPTRLNKWLYAIEDSGGRVDVHDTSGVNREMDVSLLIAVVGLAASLYDEIRKNAYYADAEAYDAVMVIDRLSNVTEIRFLARHASTK